MHDKKTFWLGHNCSPMIWTKLSRHPHTWLSSST